MSRTQLLKWVIPIGGAIGWLVAGVSTYGLKTRPYIVMEKTRVGIEETRLEAEQMKALFEAMKSGNPETWRQALSASRVTFRDPNAIQFCREELSRLDELPKLKEKYAALQSQSQTLLTEKRSLDSAVLGLEKRVGELEDVLEREIPVIAWTYPQEPNTVVCEEQFTVCWRITNKAENQGFLVTLADTSVDTSGEFYSFNPEVTLRLKPLRTSNYRIAVLPLSRHGMEYCGTPITCSFDYRPPSSILIQAEAQPPLIRVSAVDKEREGEPVEVYRMALSGKWVSMPNGRFVVVPGLCPGAHTVRLKAVNSKGIAAFQDFPFAVEDSPPRPIDPKSIIRMQAGQSLASVIAEAQPGSRILIPPGVHEGGFNLDKVLELVGDGPRDKVIISCYDPGTGNQSCIRIGKVGGFLLKGLTVTYETLDNFEYGHYPPRYHAAAVAVEGQKVVIENCEIRSKGNQYAVRIEEGAHNFAIRRTYIKGGETSLFFGGSDTYSFNRASGVVEDSRILKSTTGNHSCELREYAQVIFQRCGFLGSLLCGKSKGSTYAYRFHDCDFEANPLEN